MLHIYQPNERSSDAFPVIIWSQIRSYVSSIMEVDDTNPFNDSSEVSLKVLAYKNGGPESSGRVHVNIRRGYVGDGVSNRIGNQSYDSVDNIQTFMQSIFVTEQIKSDEQLGDTLWEWVNGSDKLIFMEPVITGVIRDSYIIRQQPEALCIQSQDSYIKELTESLEIPPLEESVKFKPEIGPMCFIKKDVDLRRLNVGQLKWGLFLEHILFESNIHPPAVPTSYFMIVSCFNSKREGVDLEGMDPFTYLDTYKDKYKGWNRPTKLDIYVPTFNPVVNRVQLLHIVLI